MRFLITTHRFQEACIPVNTNVKLKRHQLNIFFQICFECSTNYKPQPETQTAAYSRIRRRIFASRKSAEK